MTEHAMLDVSMLAHRVPLARLRRLAQEQPAALSGLIVSESFVRLMKSLAGEAEENFGIDLISRYFHVPRRMVDLGSLRQFLDSGVFHRQVIQLYRRESFTESPPLYRALLDSTGNEWATQIMFEEWDYLMNHSWLFSKTRAIYDHVIDAGANALYVTKRKLEKVVRATTHVATGAGHAILKTSDTVVGKTLKKPADQKISPNDRVRALAKWVAVGGSAATGLMVPIAGVAVSTMTGLFLLYDP